MQANAETIRSVVQEVLAQLGKAPKQSAPHRDGDLGVFQSVDQAVAAATEGFKKLSASPLEARKTIIEIVRKMCDEQAEELGRLEFEETKIGRLDHKIEKLKIIKRGQW